MLTTLEEAARLHASGNIPAALTLYREILRQSPRDPDALHMMGVIAQQGGNSQLALQFIEAALGAKPDFARAWFNRGIILRALGRSAEALQSARMAADTEPDLAETWDLIGQIEKDNGHYAEAARSHQRAIALQPANAHFYGNYAGLLLSTGDLPAAYEAARRASTLDDRWPPLVFGNIISAMGYPELAAEQFMRARALCPASTEMAVNEATVRLQTGDTEKGLALWELRPDFESSLSPPIMAGTEG